MNHSHMAANYPKGRERDRVKVACLHDGKKIKYWSVQAEVIVDIVRYKTWGLCLSEMSTFVLNGQKLDICQLDFH